MVSDKDIDTGGPAFPDNSGSFFWMSTDNPGISKRDLFAGMSLMGQRTREISGNDPITAARLAYDDADAMIAEGKK